MLLPARLVFMCAGVCLPSLHLFSYEHDEVHTLLADGAEYLLIKDGCTLSLAGSMHFLITSRWPWIVSLLCGLS